MNSFWWGVASIFDFFGVLGKSIEVKSDSEAIKDDWKKIIQLDHLDENPEFWEENEF